MKTYPSISRFNPKRHQNFCGPTFDKKDGSNLRFEWNSKQGWFRFGSRRRLLDETHPTFGIAMQHFQDQFAETFERAATENRWNNFIVFAEFWGPSSLGGFHEPGEPKYLTPMDIAVHRQGILTPQQFLRCFDDKIDLGYLGERSWDESFLEQVKNSKLQGMGLEGVVGKSGSGSRRTAIKLKSDAWKRRVIEVCGEAQGQQIINS